MLQYLTPAFFAFGLTALLCFGVLKFFPKWGLMDRPWKYGLKRKPIPYYAGMVFFIVFFLSVALFVPLNNQLLAFFIGASVLTVVSFLDDYFGLSPYLRFVIQIMCALILFFGGIGVFSLSNPFGGPILLNLGEVSFEIGDLQVSFFALSALFTVVWVVTMVNSMNFLDGLQGLPSGVSSIAALTLFFLSIRPDIHTDVSSQIPIATMSIILFASTFCFWLFDFHPAKMLMGDTGSMFLGFTLAALAIFSGGKVATAFLVLGFPILDAGWVIIRRILQKKSPFKGDLKHLHHRLLEAGFSPRQAILFLYLICALFGVIAVLFQGVQKFYAIAVLIALMFIVGGFVVYLQKNNKNKKKSTQSDY